MEEALDSVEALDSIEMLDTVEQALDNVEVMDSIEQTLDNIEPLDIDEAVDSVKSLDFVEALDIVDVMPDSVEMVPDSVESLCPRCGTFHASGVFGEACFQACRHIRRCARCGLLHEDYDLPARWLHGMEKFDCEFYVTDVEKLQMDGDTILLPDDVIKKLDEIYNMKKLEDTKMKQDAKEQ
ncbi:unnamed protein product [Miscanthus lutarioriparius]|uniref:Uncharacterized protein n=1 Tax=Miscanthus lutarioriparius TaxID=422564 RepID=A0A811NAV4_9POAL|nr:unnamed protein product [Miscanthus lutarioriparius]